jgi:hypothetical protein
VLPDPDGLLTPFYKFTSEVNHIDLYGDNDNLVVYISGVNVKPEIYSSNNTKNSGANIKSKVLTTLNLKSLSLGRTTVSLAPNYRRWINVNQGTVPYIHLYFAIRTQGNIERPIIMPPYSSAHVKLVLKTFE